LTKDWDDAYANSAHIQGAERILARLAADAAAFRARALGKTDIPYGLGARLKYDLFLPAGTPQGLVLFFHGGYWMQFDKSSWSHLAAGPVKRGWAVAIPSYDLCPGVRIAEIVRQAAAAVFAAARAVAGPIILTGHSAGGHLAARLMCTPSPLEAGLIARLRRIVGISGLYDLRPLMRTGLNETLKLDLAEARAESPALLEPITGPEFAAWVGEGERPEFRRQTALIANVWSGFDTLAQEVVAPDRHHFDVFAPLADAGSPLVDALLGDHGRD
jgi:acetyl esterase/lipase